MTKQLVPLSVIILTHRRDQRFIQALKSAQSAAEVIVVDYQSGNPWPTLRKRFRFKLFTRSEPIANFAGERNRAMQRASYDWVFFLDSDEVIESASWDEIQRVVTNSDLSGAYIRRQDIFYGQPLGFGETGQVWLLRLMKKTQARFARPVHEVSMVMGKSKRVEITLSHYAHQSISEFFQDVGHYAELEAEYQADYQLPVWRLSLKTLAYPGAKFIVNYFFKLGFLDGWRGLVYAVMMSLHSLWTRVFAYENR